MQLKEAIGLIDHEKFKPKSKQNWYDLGAGTGTFTIALAHLLPKGSKIFAIDNNAAALRQIPATAGNADIKTIQQDFTLAELPYRDFDGVFMGNSLHYVKNKISFIEKIQTSLKPGHSFFIVEYDTEKGNQWVPYPVSFKSLQELFKNAGYDSIIKLHERPSKYNSNLMYSALIRSEPGF
jgi:SAM-dependent methyltransferase